MSKLEVKNFWWPATLSRSFESRGIWREWRAPSILEDVHVMGLFGMSFRRAPRVWMGRGYAHGGGAARLCGIKNSKEPPLCRHYRNWGLLTLASELTRLRVRGNLERVGGIPSFGRCQFFRAPQALCPRGCIPRGCCAKCACGLEYKTSGRSFLVAGVRVTLMKKERKPGIDGPHQRQSNVGTSSSASTPLHS